MTELLCIRLVGDRSPRSARLEAPRVLTGQFSPEVLNDVLVVLSELVSNAVSHNGGMCTVAIRVIAAHLYVEVHDSDTPGVRRTWDRSGLGHGLGVVQTVANRWGIERTPTGKCVWAELPAAHSDTVVF